MTTGLNQLRGPRPYNNLYDPKFPRIDLDPRKFNALIDQYGVKLTHESASGCPNYVGPITTQQHDINCRICDHSYLYYGARDIIGYFNTNEVTRNFVRGGFWEEGTVLLSTPSFYPDNEDDQVYFSYFDKLTLVDFEEKFYELVHMSDDGITRLRYRALKILLLRTAKKEYFPDQHFKINENGDIEWTSVDRPSKDLLQNLGELMTISYLHRPVFRVTKLIHEGRYSQIGFKQQNRIPIRLPQQVLIKKDFLMDKKDKDGDVIEEPLFP